MATYVIGDVHGCFETLQALWPQLGFDLRRDRLWLVGDLVNRGPRSRDVLRWARDLDERLGDRMRVVLGNHDLHLLAVHDGHAESRRKDTLEDVLAAPDREQLVAWLARQPLVHLDGEVLLVHGGLLPHWTPEDAEEVARGLEAILRAPDLRRPLIDRAFVPADDSPWVRRRAELSAFVALRTCTAAGEPCSYKGPPAEAPPGCLPWFRVPGRRSSNVTVVFGHWGALGLLVEPTAIGLETGCRWGKCLTAIRLEDRTLFQQPTVEPLPPAFFRRRRPATGRDEL